MRTVLLFVFVWGFLIHHSQELAKEFRYESNVDSLGIYDTDLLPASFHKENRKKVRALMPDSTMAIYYAGTEKVRSNDVSYEFHQDPDFYYLTG